VSLCLECTLESLCHCVTVLLCHCVTVSLGPGVHSVCFVTVFFVGRVPLYGVLSFPPLAYSVPDLVNSKLGWTALDVVRRGCVQLFSILWFIRRPGEGGLQPCTLMHNAALQH